MTMGLDLKAAAEALEWYAAQAQRIRDWQAGKIASLGGVYALRDDGGERARAALAPGQPPVDSETAASRAMVGGAVTRGEGK